VEQNEFACVVNFMKGFDDRLRGVGGCRKNFQHAQPASFDPHAVGEGASGVDGDAERLGAAGHVGGAD
jgi:hypothetical protein